MEKPKEIVELENKLNITLDELKNGGIFDWVNRNTYQLNTDGELISLNLRSNQIKDYTFLQNLKQLIILDLSHNQIKDITVLQDLKGLTNLNLSANQIRNISFLKDLKELTALDLSSNHQITDISFLKDLKRLTTLNLSASQIRDISFLQDLKGLRVLHLWKNQITDISFLQDLKGLTYLDLSHNQITDFSFLKDLKQLNALNISENPITDCSFLQHLKQLTALHLGRNRIKDYSFLQDLIALTTLDLSGNEIKDYSFLQDLISLTTLDLSFNLISDISFLQDLKGLTTLYLRRNQITDISFLKKLKALTSLDLSRNHIIDISFLQDLNRLTSLILIENQITDFSFLENLKELTFLDLSRNQITDLNKFSFIKGLKALNILALDNPCFTDHGIFLINQYNHYDIIVNELIKLEEATKTDAVEGFLPEKIVLLGNHGCGKSSLLHYLENGNLNYNHDSTHILNIQPYKIDKKNKLPKAMIYDFGGQDFYHGIYQTFLTPNAISLMFWNNKTNSNLWDKDRYDYPIRNYNVNYWLGQWKNKIQSGEILLVQTHKDNDTDGKKSYCNLNQNIKEEFYISLEKEETVEISNKTKQSALIYVQETLDEIIQKRQKEKNPNNRISKIYYDFIKVLIEKGRRQKEKPISKSELKEFYENVTNERLNTELEQLHLSGMLIVNEDNVWLNPVALTEFVHKKLTKNKIDKKGVLKENDLIKLRLSEPIKKLLLDNRVLFEHKYGVDENNNVIKEYIIPNYLPLIKDSGIDYDLMVFGLDNPLFILKFKDFLPFGLINQMICYFGNLPDRKKFWRDQLVFTISEEVENEKESKKQCKILIKLNFDTLKIEVYGTFNKSSDILFKNEITKYLFYVILSFYKGTNIDYVDFNRYKKHKIEIIENLNRFYTLSEENNDLKKQYRHVDSYGGILSSPSDMYLSLDNKVFINHEELEKAENETTIKTYNENLEIQREKPIGSYQNFTDKKLKKMKKIFISYSNQEHNYKETLLKHLKPLKQFELLKPWSCEDMTTGNWDNQIQKELAEADIVLFMMSIDFITSDYILREEVYKTFQDIKNNPNKEVVCVLVKNFSWQHFEQFKNLTNLNDVDFEKLKDASTIFELTSKQFIPYYIENKGKENAKRYLQPINKWEYEEDAFVEIINNLSKILSK